MRGVGVCLLLGPSIWLTHTPSQNTHTQCTAAIFFSVYETMKGALEPAADAGYAPLVHMAAASVGETVRGHLQARSGPPKKTNLASLWSG